MDVQSLVDALGGRRRAASLISMSGLKCSEKQIGKWCERRSIPSRYLVRIMEIARLTNKRIPLRQALDPNERMDDQQATKFLTSIKGTANASASHHATSRAGSNPRRSVA